MSRHDQWPSLGSCHNAEVASAAFQETGDPAGALMPRDAAGCRRFPRDAVSLRFRQAD